MLKATSVNVTITDRNGYTLKELTVACDAPMATAVEIAALLKDQYGVEVEEVSHAVQPESDASYRERILPSIPWNDINRANACTATGAALDAIGDRYLVQRK